MQQGTSPTEKQRNCYKIISRQRSGLCLRISALTSAADLIWIKDKERKMEIWKIV